MVARFAHEVDMSEEANGATTTGPSTAYAYIVCPSTLLNAIALNRSCARPSTAWKATH